MEMAINDFPLVKEITKSPFWTGLLKIISFGRINPNGDVIFKVMVVLDITLKVALVPGEHPKTSIGLLVPRSTGHEILKRPRPIVVMWPFFGCSGGGGQNLVLMHLVVVQIGGTFQDPLELQVAEITL